MFKVVQTVEDDDGCVKMFVVPNAWETVGVVYWPEKMNSKQFKTIKKMHCVARAESKGLRVTKQRMVPARKRNLKR